MLNANVFYSLYSVPVGILSLLVGSLSVMFIYGSKDFRGVFLFLSGGLLAFAANYLAANEIILYKVGLNSAFIIFIDMIIALVISLLWLNASSELNSGRLLDSASMTFYISACLAISIYYSFIAYNDGLGKSFFVLLQLTGLAVLLVTTVRRCWQNFSLYMFFLFLTSLMLCGKMVVSAYFFQYNWLNLNIFNWSWIYTFVASMVFGKIDLLNNDLQKSWNQIDKLNLQLTNMINFSPFPIILAKITGNRIISVNRKAEILFGITSKEVGYYQLSDFFIDEKNRNELFKTLETNHEVEDFDLMVSNIINNTPFWLSVSAKTITYNNELVLYLAFQNITLRKERENRLQNQADNDALTMAWNRRYFEKQIPLRIKEIIKKSQYFSLLMIDADKFKNINDTYGHKAGDSVLIELVDICKNSLRSNDVVCRFGGEEFVIYLDNTNSAAAMSVAERLRRTIEEAGVTDDNGNIIKFTVSIGVVSSEKTDSLDILLKQVDDAMYLAKNNGRNRIELYDEEAIRKIMKKRTAKASVHPVFNSEENEEISLLDNYDNHIISEDL